MRRRALVVLAGVLCAMLLAGCGGDRGFDEDSGSVGVDDLPALFGEAVASWGAQEVARQAVPPPACDPFQRTSCRSLDPPAVAIAYRVPSGEELLLQVVVATSRDEAREQLQRMLKRTAGAPRSLLEATPATGSLAPAPAGTCDPNASAEQPSACVAHEVKAPAIGSQSKALAGEAAGGRRAFHVIFRRGYLVAEISALSTDEEAASKLARDVAKSLDTALQQRLEQ